MGEQTTTLNSGAAGTGAEGEHGPAILAAKPVLKEPWSMQRTATITGGDGTLIGYPGMNGIHFTAPVNPDTARDWLPDNLTPADPAMATFYIVDIPRTSFGIEYQEAGLFIHCLYEDQEHMFCAWMVLNDITPLILGREAMGLPKKLAEVQVDTTQAHPSGIVRRRGYTLLEVQGANPTPIDNGAIFQLPILNVRGLLGDPAPQLFRSHGSHRLQWGNQVDLQLNVGQSEFDPLHKLDLPATLKGEHLCDDIGVPGLPPTLELTQGPIAQVSTEWYFKAYPFRSY